MRYLKSTVKWEIRKWWAYVLSPVIVGLGVYLVLLWILFVPLGFDSFVQTGWTVIYILVGLPVLLAVLYMTVVYPSFSIVSYTFAPTNLTEHGSGRPYAIVLVVRLVIASITYALGIGIVVVSILLFDGLEWGIVQAFTTGPRCVYGTYGACVAYLEAVCICEPSLMYFIADAAGMMPVLVLMLPAVFLLSLVTSSSQRESKWLWVSAILLLAFSGLIVLQAVANLFFTGINIPAALLTVHAFLPIIFFIPACKLIDRSCDIYGVIFK